jgi:oligoendopeptidase F
MFENLPRDYKTFMGWDWSQIEPFAKDLEAREINDGNVIAWLTDWSHLGQLLGETYSRLYVATTVNTEDEEAQKRFFSYIENIAPPARSANNRLNQKLLASGLQPAGYDIHLRNMRVDAELFREENLALYTQEEKLGTEFDKVIGAQTIMWDGAELTLPQTKPLMLLTDRAKREAAWRAASARQLQDKDTLNGLWEQFLQLRTQVASNADQVDFRAFQWRNFHRFDYLPEDCTAFHNAIEQVVVPAAKRIYEKRRKRLGVDSLRPWDLDVDPLSREPLKPFDAKDIDSLNNKTLAMFRKVDPQLGSYYKTMMDEGLLDLENHKGKAPGGYCITFPHSKRPFIFMNAVGIHNDVQTLLHEGGHAFHAFEASKLPDYQDGDIPIEFCEVASMSMELIAAPYLSEREGGFYSDDDAARARVEHLEGMILFWPYMAVVDAFQQWVYTNPEEAKNTANCDAKWATLWDRFMQGIDYSGLEDAKVDGWHRKLHIFQIPFYYVEYGMAQLGAAQVWRNSLKDQAGAVASYLRGLALGGTVTLPKLFETAGAKFAWDAATLGEAVSLIEATCEQLDPA